MVQRYPPPPDALPGVREEAPGKAVVCDPPPPTCLPGTGKAQALTPPPPTDLPSAQDTLPCLLTAPPPPVALPGAAQLPFSPPPPEKLPGRSDAEEKLNRPETVIQEQQAQEKEESDYEGSESGEDSDVSVPPNYERHRTDLHALMAHHSSVIRATTRQRGSNEETEDLPNSAHELAQQRLKEGKEASEKRPVKDSKEKQSFLSRFFHSAVGGEAQGPKESILDQDISRLDEAWIRHWSNVLEKEGIFCTKIATNGKPYKRCLHVDSRNLMVEVHQGRNGTVGISLDDLVDLRKDLGSPEFKKFCQRHKTGEDLSSRVLILQTPARTFSFCFRNASQRDVMGHFLIYLLKSRGRGVMADAASTATRDEPPATSAPKEGCGRVLYSNNSCYEGELFQYMRHGHGILHLPDGTKHESEWRNDERHGPGKEHWADGTIFSGHFVRGLRHGLGTMTWPEGSKYTGMFQRGRANGDGELIRTDNSVYRGQFVQDCMSGTGSMKWVDGVEYTGEFANNKRHGEGKMVWTSGKWMSYDGSWKDGVQHGRGVLTDRNGVAYVGHFIEGKLDHWEKVPASSPERSKECQT